MVTPRRAIPRLLLEAHTLQQKSNEVRGNLPVRTIGKYWSTSLETLKPRMRSACLHYAPVTVQTQHCRSAAACYCNRPFPQGSTTRLAESRASIQPGQSAARFGDTAANYERALKLRLA